MKAYVITIPQSTRLVDGKIPNYPKCLPEPEVVIGPTPDDGVKAPDWYVPHYKLHGFDADTNWCIILSKLNALKKHLELYPNEDCILFEDDVYFCDNFDIVYPSFMDKVPDNWDMIYMGGRYHKRPVEVVPDVVKCRSVVYNEFIIIRSTFIHTIIKLLESGPWGLTNQIVDGIINSIVNVNNVYAPIPFFAGQLPGYSYNLKCKLSQGILVEFDYITINNEAAVSSSEDYHRYMINNLKMYDKAKPTASEVASVSLFGDNIYYLLCALLFIKNELPKLNMPLLIHSDRANAELLDVAVKEEGLDVSNVYLRLHEDSQKLEGMLWRYEPNLSEFTHVFDIDMPISLLQLDAVNEHKYTDWYTCWTLKMHNQILGGMSGFSNKLLQSIYPLIKIWGLKKAYTYGFDEDCLITMVPTISDNGLIYRNPKSTRSPLIDNVCRKDHIESNKCYKPSAFTELKNCNNNVYIINNKEYAVNGKGR